MHEIGGRAPAEGENVVCFSHGLVRDSTLKSLRQAGLRKLATSKNLPLDANGAVFQDSRSVHEALGRSADRLPGPLLMGASRGKDRGLQPAVQPGHGLRSFEKYPFQQIVKNL